MRRLVFAATAGFQVETLILPVVPSLEAHGWTVHIVSSDFAAPDVASATVFHQLRMTRSISPFTDLSGLRQWIRLLRRISPHAVISGSPKASLLALLAARVTRVPTRVYLIRGLRWQSEIGILRRLLIAMERVTIGCATDVLAVSKSVAEALTLEASIPAGTVTVLGRGGSKGVDFCRFQLNPASDGPPTIGYVGRLASDKGIESLFRILDAVKVEIPDCRLLIAGGVDNGGQLPPEALDGLERSDVEWLGHRDDLETVYPRLQLMVFPSSREGLPNAVLEAAACGVPVVAWDVTGVRDAVVSGDTGMLVPFGQECAMAEHIVRLLADPESRLRMGKRAHEYCYEHFRSDLVQERFAAFVDAATELPEPMS